MTPDGKVVPMAVELTSWVKTFAQEADTCSNETTQDLIVEQEDGGGGPFWRLRTPEWSFDSLDELIELLEKAGVGRRKMEGT